MQLLTLNLHKRLSWSKAAAARIAGAGDALSAAMSAPEGAEIVLSWAWDAVVAGTPDGPRVRRPLPAPALVAASGLGGQGADAAAPDDAETLDTGGYLFTQARPSERPGDGGLGDDLAEAIEWFAREAWWQRMEADGPLVVRLVHEDGKTAIQVLRRLADKPRA